MALHTRNQICAWLRLQAAKAVYQTAIELINYASLVLMSLVNSSARCPFTCQTRSKRCLITRVDSD